MLKKSVYSFCIALLSTLVIFLSGNSNILAQTPRYTGMNVGGPADWEEARAFADLMKSSRKWQKLDNTDAIVDVNGWPTTDAYVYVHHGVDRFQGTHKLSYKGNGIVTAKLSNVQIINKVYDAATNTTTADLINQSTGTDGLILEFTGIAGGVKDVKLMRPTTLGGTQAYPFGTLFTNQFKAAIAKSDMIRTMDMSHTNSSDEATWADRTLPTYATYYRSKDSYTAGQGKNRSIPWEILVAMANESNKDLWICIPLYADDNYVTQLANLIKNGANGYAGLNPNLKVYVEYSNELWNTAPNFTQSVQNWNLAKAEVAAGGSNLNYDGETNDWYWAWRRIGKRTREVANLFKNVFGQSQMISRVRPVLCWQQGAEQVTAKNIFMYLSDNYPTEKVADYIFGGGGSAYYAPDFGATLTAQNIWTTNTMNVNTWKEIIKKDVGWTSAFNIQYLCYEGGSGFDKCYCPNDPVMQAAWDTPEHYQSMIDHQKTFDEMGGFMLGYFTIATYQAREWGFTENIYNLNTQKFNALDAIRAAPKAALAYGNLAPSSFFPSDFNMTNTWASSSLGGSRTISSNDQYGYPIRTNTSGTYALQIEYQYAQTGAEVELLLGQTSLGKVTLTANLTNTLTATFANTLTINAGQLYSVRLKGTNGSCTMMKINLVAPTAPLTCATPTTPVSSNITTTTATATWTAVSGATNYTLRYRPTNSTTWTTQTTSATNSALTNLSASTTYEVQIATNCSNGATSSFSSSATFTTLSNVVTPPTIGLAAVINFENTTVGNLATAVYNDPSGYTFEDFGGGGSNNLFSRGTAQGYASKCIRNENFGRGIRLRKTNGGAFNLLSFDHAGDEWGGTADATVTAYFANGTTAAITISRNVKTYAKRTFTWTNLLKVEINYAGGTTTNFGVIDNVSVTDVTYCPAVTGAAAVTPTHNNATLSWNASANAASYIVEYRLATAATWTTLTPTTASATLVNLSASSNYQYKISTKCTNTGQSQVGITGNFTTLAPPFVNTVVTFESATVGNLGAATYAENGYTLEDFGFASNNLVIKDVTAGFASRCMRNENFSRGIRLRKTDNATFNLNAFDFAGDDWGGTADATVTGFLSNGTTVSTTVTNATKTYTNLSLNWTNLTKVEINFEGGVSNNFGVIDNISLSALPTVAALVVNNNLTDNKLSTKQNLNITSIYPNPTHNILNINNIENVYKISIFNINGQVIRAYDVINTSIEIEDLENGTYFISLEKNNATKEVLRFVKM